MSKRRYFKLKMRGRKNLIVEVTGDIKDGPLVGFEVWKTGERKYTETKTSVTEYAVVFKATDIVQELTMNLHYAELE